MTSSSPAPSRTLLVALGLLLAAGPALAQQEEPPPEDQAAPGEPEQAGEVIIIYGEQEIVRRRAELDGIIQDYGYREGKRRGDRTIYRPEVPWKPSIVIQEEGLVTLKRSPVRWMAPGRQDNALNHLWCLPPFTPMCVRIGGQIVSTPKLDAAKGRVMDEIHDPSEAWRQAIVNQATWARVNEEVPRRVEATWKTGAPLETGGPELPTHEERRAALLAFWASRSDGPEGDMVAQVVADFLELEVQASPHPVTAEELAAANAAAAGVRALELTIPAPPGPPDPG